MPSSVLRIATRQSALALWQAEHVRSRLLEAHPGLQVELLGMTTLGDRILDRPLAMIGGDKGLFVKELEQAMLEDRADIAVHSMKDVLLEFPEGLHLPVMCAREDARDAFVSNIFPRLDALPEGARVGTSSLRRQFQLYALRPDIKVVSLRGNVNTRLKRLDGGEFDAIILAVAGLTRLGFGERITQYLDLETSLPAIGQGVIGIECRSDDERINALIRVLHDPSTYIRVSAERAMNYRLQGGCQVPIAGHAEIEADRLTLRGAVGMPDGSKVVSGIISGPIQEALHLGTALADDILARGAQAILQEVFAGEHGG